MWPRRRTGPSPTPSCFIGVRLGKTWVSSSWTCGESWSLSLQSLWRSVCAQWTLEQLSSAYMCRYMTNICFNIWIKHVLSFLLCCLTLTLHFSLYQVRKKNVLKDFVAIAGPLGVTHFMIFNKTPSSLNMVSSDRTVTKRFLLCVQSGALFGQQLLFLCLQRLARLPKGPTLHFRVLKVNIWPYN